MNRPLHRRRRGIRIQTWFLRKHRRADHFHIGELSDNSDFEDDMIDLSVSPAEISRCDSTETDELRIFVGTWNVAGKSPAGGCLTLDLEEWLNPKDAADIYVLGFQEIVPLKPVTVIGAEDQTKANSWNVLIGKVLNEKPGLPWLTPMPVSTDSYCYDLQTCNSISNPSSSRYKLIASRKMVGVFISVWIRKNLLRKFQVSNIRTCSVGCGVMGCLGNKGSVSVSMSIDGSSLCFIAAHLASGEKTGDEGRRNHQVSQIFHRTFFDQPRRSKKENSHHSLTILGHDQIFWLGDLNYRLYLEDNSARQLIEKRDWRALQEFDQLRKELEVGGVFQGWKEGNIEFAPTYKYSSLNCNSYSGEFPRRSGEKSRTPAWCDRILWYGKGVKQLSYLRSESKFSDHRPVSALFSIQIKVAKAATNLRPRITPLPADPVIAREKPASQMVQNIIEEELKPTLQSLITKDIESEVSP